MEELGAWAKFKYHISCADILFPFELIKTIAVSLMADSDGLAVNAPSLIRGREQKKNRFEKVKIPFYLASLQI